MKKRVLNTVVVNATGSSGGGENPTADKFIYWGVTEKNSEFNSQDILALNDEQRPDRFIQIDNWNSQGKKMIAAFPEDYQSEGLFQDVNTLFSYPFDNKGKVQVTDAEGNTYMVDVFVWRNTSYGIISLIAK